MLLISFSAFLACSLIGYLISSQNEKIPTGLIKIQSISDNIVEGNKWHLPFSVIGIALGFLFNLVIYAFNTLNVILHYIHFVIKWLYDNILVVLASVLYKVLLMFVALWKWLFDRLIIPFLNIAYRIILMVLDVLLLLLRLFKHYIILIPIDLFLHCVYAVVPTLRWSNYLKSILVISVGMVSIAVFNFIGYLFSMPIIGDIGLYLSLVAVISWIVGLVSFGSHKHGRRATLFSGTLIGVTVILLVFTFGINQLDDLHKWGGNWTGFWYAPSIIFITIAILIGLTLIFMSNVGSIFVNTCDQNLNYRQRLIGFAKTAFNRAWSFSIQPLMVVFIGAIIVTIPALLIYFSTLSLDKLVSNVVTENGIQIDKSIKENRISHKMVQLLRDNTLSDLEFNQCLDTLEIERNWILLKNENNLYSEFFKREISAIGFKVMPVMDKDTLENLIQGMEKNINRIKEEERRRIVEDNKTLRGMNSNSFYSSEDVALHELYMKRSARLFKSVIKSANEELNFKKSCGLHYFVTLFLFLLGKALIIGLLLTLVINLFGFSTKPIYDMNSTNYLAEQIKEAHSTNRLQPWLGFIFLTLLVVLLTTSVNLKGLSSTFDVLGRQDTKSEKNMTIQKNNNLSEVDSLQTSTLTDSGNIEQETDQETVDPEENEAMGFFICHDGKEIPTSYFNDGQCDCSGCEDESN